MQEKVKDILATLISISIQSDCEMVNMGDWNIEDLNKVISKKTETIKDLKDPEFDMATIPHEYFYRAIHDLILYFRTFGPNDRGLDELQKVEHKLAKYCYSHFRG